MSVTRMSWDEVRARRLHRHGLAEPFADAGPADVVAAMAGTHAQVMSAAELAIAARLAKATRADVRAALWEDRSLVKTYGPRGTVHFLPARDLHLWVGLLAPLASAPTNFAPGVRLTPGQADEIVAAIATALDGAELTLDELGAEVVRLTGPWAGELVMPAFQGLWPRWRQAMHLAGMRGVLCFAPNRGRKATYTGPPPFRPADPDTAVAWAVRSYLHAYGPSTPERFANWLVVPVPRAAEMFAAQGDDLHQVDVEGTKAWVSAGDLETPEDPPTGVRLLPYFDGYSYRVGVQSPELLYPGPAADRVMPGNFQNLVVDGVVAGLWHQRRSGRNLHITVEPLIPLTPAQHSDLEAQSARVATILEATPHLTIGKVTAGPHA